MAPALQAIRPAAMRSSGLHRSSAPPKESLRLPLVHAAHRPLVVAVAAANGVKVFSAGTGVGAGKVFSASTACGSAAGNRRPVVTARADNGKVFEAGTDNGNGKVFNASTGGNGGASGGSGSGAGGSGSGSSSGGGDAKHPMQLWTYLFAAFLAVGGTMGFVKAGSPKSLGSGLSAALVLGLAARAMTGPGAVAGARVALGITVLLLLFFIKRYMKTKKVVPAGLGVGLSVLMIGGFVASGI